MTIEELLTELSRLDIKIFINNEDQIKVDGPEDVLTDDLIEQIRQHKSELLNQLKAERQDGSSFTREIQAASREANIPLSLSQERLWNLIKSGLDSTVYNVCLAFQLKGVLDQDLLDKSLMEIIRRHEILRTSFQESEFGCAEIQGSEEDRSQPEKTYKLPVQMISNDIKSPLSVVDLSKSSIDDRKSQAIALIIEYAKKEFNLSEGSLLRFKLIRLGPEHYMLGLCVHHLVADYWSINLIFRELTYLYSAFLKGEHLSLPELQIQYADYSIWQRQAIKEQTLDSLLDYWKNLFKGEVQTLKLPVNYTNTLDQGYQGTQKEFTLSQSLTQELKKLSQQQGVTLYVTLLSALGIVFHCYSNQEDIIISSPFSGRSQPELENLIGYFNNVLPLRIDFSGNLRFRDLLLRIKDVVVSATKYQDLPLQKLMEFPNLKRINLTRAVFALQSTLDKPLNNLEGFTVSRLNIHNGKSNFDLYLQMWEENDQLVGSLEYRTSLFQAEAIDCMIQDYLKVLDQLVAQQDTSLQELKSQLDLPVLNEPEEESLDRNYAAPRDETEQQLVNIWEEILGLTRVGIHDSLLTLGGNSFLAILITETINKNFEKTISVPDLYRLGTIEKIARFIHSGDIEGIQLPSIIPLQKEGSAPPLFMVTPVFYAGLVYSRLPYFTGKNYPIFVLKFAKDTSDYSPENYKTIEERAEECVNEICQLQRQGPYNIGGYCLGSFLAFEIAQRLIAKGEKVDNLFIFDTEAKIQPLLSKKGFWRSLFVLTLGNLRVNLLYLTNSFRLLMQRNVNSNDPLSPHLLGTDLINYHPRPPAGKGLLYSLWAKAKAQGLLNRWYREDFVNPRKLASQYQAWALVDFASRKRKRYPGRITLFLAKHELGFKNLLVASGGWDLACSGGVDVHVVEADHYNLFFRDKSLIQISKVISDKLNS